MWPQTILGPRPWTPSIFTPHLAVAGAATARKVKILTLKQRFAAVLVIVASAVDFDKRRDFENDLNMIALQTKTMTIPTTLRA